MYCCNLFAVIVYVNSFCCMFFCTVLLSMKIWCTNCIMYEIKIMIIIALADGANKHISSAYNT